MALSAADGASFGLKMASFYIYVIFTTDLLALVMGRKTLVAEVLSSDPTFRFSSSAFAPKNQPLKNKVFF